MSGGVANHGCTNCVGGSILRCRIMGSSTEEEGMEEGGPALCYPNLRTSPTAHGDDGPEETLSHDFGFLSGRPNLDRDDLVLSSGTTTYLLVDPLVRGLQLAPQRSRGKHVAT